MQQRNTTGILILLMTSVMVMGGCGWISGGDDPASSSGTSSSTSSAPPSASSLKAVSKAVYSYSIYTLTPTQGYLTGGESIHITGNFPNIANASTIYTVYFADKPAKYNTAFSPAYHVYNLYVTAPAGDTPGLVSVSLFDRVANVYSASLGSAYEYIDPIEIIELIPDEGPLPGGTFVTVRGRFSVSAAIYSLALANASYSVTIDGTAATFTPNSLGQFITPDAMYITTPPGSIPGLVDVAVTTSIYGTRTLTDGFTYYDDFEIFSVDPNQGHITGGTSAEVIGRFPIASAIYNLTEANFAYNVKFDGNRASFVPNALGQFITPTAMYVTTPPGSRLGTVDVTVAAAGRGERILPSGFTYFDDFELFTVDPNRGHVSGGDFIELAGNYPVAGAIYNVSAARAAYTVYFGSEPAGFGRSTTGPLITADMMYVVAPVARSVETVEVSIATINGIYTTYAAYTPGLNEYEYFRNMELGFIYPDFGPLGILNPVQVHAKLPLTADITSLLTAESLYGVDIDDDLTTYRAFSPFIEITTAYGEYNAILHMLTPPGKSLGLKDAALHDFGGFGPIVITRDAPINDTLNLEFPAKKADAYEYIGGGGTLGQWTNVNIAPNPVGPLDAGELEVVITVTGDATAILNAFIVPQGGNPNNQDHRIALSGSSTSATTWTGTNAIQITTKMYNEPDLYADGHAAIYLNTLNDGIVGDDFLSPYNDSGKIGSNALSKRHFTIDTIPPIMVVTGTGEAYEFVNPLAVSLSGTGTTPGQEIFASGYPYSPPGGGEINVTEVAPYSTDNITSIPESTILGAQRAQRFFNPDNALRLKVDVEFLDSEFSITGFDDNFENGDGNIRYPAGFENSVPIILYGNENEILIGEAGDGRILARWVLQGGSTSLPKMEAVRVDYQPFGSSIGGFVNNLNGNPSVFSMLATWDIISGIYAGDVSDPMHLVTKFAAGDRATIYLPRGTGNLDSNARSVMTRREDQLDPLHLWWMREVNTDIIHDNIPANGVTRNPFFEWEIVNRPRPELLGNNSDPNPLYYYQLWQSPDISTSPGANREDFRNGPYTLLDDSDWNRNNVTYDPTTLLSSDLNNQNRWYILLVSAIDEAGNVEQWPSELVINAGELTVTGTQSGSNNWRRFYYPSAEAEIDTVVNFRFWHDEQGYNDLFDTGERDFGNQTIIPLPAKNEFFLPALPGGNDLKHVTGLFTGSVVGNGINPTISWRVFRDGVDQGTSNLNSRLLFELGDPERIKAITYVLSATGSYTIDGNIITDPTPVNIRFTVVPDDDIQKFLRNTRSDDQQPFKETDRP